MDLDPDRSVFSQQKKEDEDEDDGPLLKDDPKYQKYFKVRLSSLVERFCLFMPQL